MNILPRHEEHTWACAGTTGPRAQLSHPVRTQNSPNPALVHGAGHTCVLRKNVPSFYPQRVVPKLVTIDQERKKLKQGRITTNINPIKTTLSF